MSLDTELSCENPSLSLKSNASLGRKRVMDFHELRSGPVQGRVHLEWTEAKMAALYLYRSKKPSVYGSDTHGII